MERYIAFLRGINVSGHKIVKMEALRSVFTEAGYVDVKTYIQSGNVLFGAEENDTKQLILKLEDLIENSFLFRTDVILRKRTDIESLVNTSQFSTYKSDDEKKYYITFLKEEYSGTIQVPTFSKNMDVEILNQNGHELVSVCTLFKGKYGFPNSFIEKHTATPATTRNPITLLKILTI